jgi:hypothetical protein
MMQVGGATEEDVKFEDLPPEVRKYLKGLRKADIEQQNRAVRFYNMLQTVGTFNAWFIMTVMGVFITFAAFGDGVRKIMSWFGKGG